jgi:hypothetical protein
MLEGGQFEVSRLETIMTIDEVYDRLDFEKKINQL